MNQFIPAAIALQFLTVFPVRLQQIPTDKQLGQSLLYYPLVGALIGLVLVAGMSVFYTLPNSIVAALTLIIWVAITGALHLDGLADSADAWMGGLGDRDKTLAIMKDPASGPVAVVVLVLVLLMKFVLLAEIISQHSSLIIIATTTLSRVALPLLFLTTPYVRANGIGALLVKNQPIRQSQMMLAVVGVLSVIFLPWLVLASTVLIFLLLRYVMEKRLQGTTGDTAGALVEIIEVWVLFSFIWVGN